MQKISKYIMALLFIGLSSAPTFAGNEVGSGGWGCYFKSPEGDKVELLDFFEGRNSDGYKYPATELLGELPENARLIPEEKMVLVKDHLNKVFDLLTTIYPSYFDGIKQTADLVLSHYELLPPEASPVVNRIDFDERLGCDSRVNLAVNPNALPVGSVINEENYRNIQFKTRHLKRMQLLNVAGLFSHEVLAIWTARAVKGGATTTNLARLINAKAFAALFGENADFSQEKFAEWLKLELGVNWTDTSPNRCMIYDAQKKFKGMAAQPAARQGFGPRYYSQITAGYQDAEHRWHWADRAVYAPKLKFDSSLNAKYGKVAIPMQQRPYIYSYYYVTVYEEIGQVSRDGIMFTPGGKIVGKLVIKDATVRDNANAVVGYFYGCRTEENTYFESLGYTSEYFPTPLARAAAAAYTLLFTRNQTYSAVGSGSSSREAINSAYALALQSCGSIDGVEYRAIVTGNGPAKLVQSGGLFRSGVYNATSSYICVPK